MRKLTKHVNNKMRSRRTKKDLAVALPANRTDDRSRGDVAGQGVARSASNGHKAHLKELTGSEVRRGG